MILCAAIKFHIEKTDKDVVLPCWRHAEAYKILEALGFGAKDGYREIAQGFITTENEFLDRSEAYIHAVRWGQLSQTTLWYKEDHDSGFYKIELFSEDLY